jgi:addiction module HigA family antidote
MNREVAWPHPGEMLLEEFLKPMGVSQYRLAKSINVPARRINEIVKGQRSISADTALRLAAFFSTDAQSWVNLQTDYDLAQARVGISDALSQIPRWSALDSDTLAA